MTKYAVLIVSGYIKNIDYYKDIIKKASLLVCSDGGANFLLNTDIIPNFIIGDLDSISKETLSYFENKKVIIKKYPTKKDKTDSEISIDIIVEQKIKEIVMIGAFGDRADHFLSNINLLYYADSKDTKMSILDENNEIILLNKEDNYIKTKIGQTISFVSISGEVKGISLSGFAYEIKDYDLENMNSILTSNIAKKEEVYVRIKKGSLLCIKVNKV